MSWLEGPYNAALTSFPNERILDCADLKHVAVRCVSYVDYNFGLRNGFTIVQNRNGLVS